MNAVAPAKPVSVAEFIQQHADADPKELLSVVLAETDRLREYNAWKAAEFREAAEVEMDADFNFKPKTMAQLKKLASMFANSAIIPEHYRGNIDNTAIAVQMALRCRVDIMTFLQSSYVVYGKPGIEGKLAIALLNRSTQVDGRVRFRPTHANGKMIACQAYAIDRVTGEELSETVTWEMVEAEGWHKEKKGQISKWVTLPSLMFQYRSAAFLARIHFPDVLMGMHTIDELEDMARSNGDSGGVATTDVGLGELSERLGAAPKQPARRRVRPADDAQAAASETTTDSKAETPTKATKSPASEQAADKAPAQQAAPSQPVKRGPGRPPKASTQPAAAAAPAAATPAAPAEPAKPAKLQNTLSVEQCINTIRQLHGPDCEQFDLQKLAAEAITHRSPTGFARGIIEKLEDDWEQFLRTDAEGVNQDPGDEDVNQAVDEGPEVLPYPDPMGQAALAYESRIRERRQVKLVKDLMTKAEIVGHPDLTEDEEAYLLSVAKRRIWEIERADAKQGKLID